METGVVFTPSQIWVWLLAICGGIVTLGGAIAVVVKWIQAIKKPNDDQNERLTSLEERVAAHDVLFSKDNTRFDQLEAGNRVIQRAMLALLDHGIDGNNVDQMKKAKADLQEHLIER